MSQANYGYASIAMLPQNGLPVTGPVSINASSSCFAIASFFDVNNNPWTPTSLQYRIDVLEGGASVLPWTAIANNLLGTVVTVLITSAQNAMVSASRRWETHQITFQITDANGNIFEARNTFTLLRTFPIGDFTADSGIVTADTSQESADQS